MAAKSLEERIECLEAVHEIQNLMGRYSYFHSAGMQEETAELWAKNAPGTAANVPTFGYYEGFEGIKRLYPGAHHYTEGERIGQMHMHPLTTPVIEVAGDGMTAKGVWISPGQETDAFEGDYTAYWAWLKYGADFIKEDGKWKFWHLSVFGLFFTSYDTPWTEHPLPTGEYPPLPDELKPDKPTTYWTSYSTTGKLELIPAPPEPYETWDESTSYVKPEYLK
jgi:hypothetical protein